ncbi:hypothetical protein [Marivirga atlantica]|uniref:Uncharacterized protein n=1 Tax=Marivirga atlantica TaxID=1548457 RepID=A0A937AFZ3_9BACT|nr:hypothetical protein [Marivirga atlantica]MBL0765779.1 hypothetical protein [Marivirga atlantica]
MEEKTFRIKTSNQFLHGIVLFTSCMFLLVVMIILAVLGLPIIAFSMLALMMLILIFAHRFPLKQYDVTITVNENDFQINDQSYQWSTVKSFTDRGSNKFHLGFTLKFTNGKKYSLFVILKKGGNLEQMYKLSDKIHLKVMEHYAYTSWGVIHTTNS